MYRPAATRARATSHPAGAHQTSRDDEAPEHQVDQEVRLYGPAQVPAPTFEQGGAGCQLPAGDTLVESELERRADHDHPYERRPEARPGQHGGQEVSRADPGGSDRQPGTDGAQHLTDAP